VRGWDGKLVIDGLRDPELKTITQFWPFYLREHRHPLNRRLHFVGTGWVFLMLIFALATENLQWLWALPVIGYGFAWVGHFFIERNKPATFKHPFKSLACDFIMFWYFLTGRLEGELAKHLAR
jgi:hypothetical protein